MLGLHIPSFYKDVSHIKSQLEDLILTWPHLERPHFQMRYWELGLQRLLWGCSSPQARPHDWYGEQVGIDVLPCQPAHYLLQKVWYKARIGGDGLPPSSWVSMRSTPFPLQGQALCISHASISWAKGDSWQKLGSCWEIRRWGGPGWSLNGGLWTYDLRAGPVWPEWDLGWGWRGKACLEFISCYFLVPLPREACQCVLSLGFLR